MDTMALSGVKYCKSNTGVDTKKQNNKPIFQPSLRLLSTAAAASTMHHSKGIDFPFVPLTGHKVVNGPCIPTNFDIMSDHTHFGDFLSTKNANFKACNQFPEFSFSQLVGGFVGSKSQLRTENRESPQIWDIVFKKLDEFINSRATERYSQHCYGFQTISRNIFDSFYEKSNPALDLAATAASYLLADGCQSLNNAKNTENTENIANSSPATQNFVEIISTPVDISALPDSLKPSHSSCNKSTVPVICELGEHLVSQPDTVHHNTSVNLPEPVEVTATSSCVIDHLVPATLAREPSFACDTTLSEGHLNSSFLREKPSPVSTEGKQSYAEVAKMNQPKSKVSLPSGTHPNSRLMCSSSKQYKKMNNHNFSRNRRDSRQRGSTDSRPWRNQVAFSRQRGTSGKREVVQMDSTIKSDVPCWKFEQDSKTVPAKISRGHQRKNHEGLKHFRNFKGSTLNTVPEMASSVMTKQDVHRVKPLVCSTPTAGELACQFYNRNKNSCMNWRCRQHLQKTSAKRDMKHVLQDNAIGESLDDQTTNADLPSSPNVESDIRPNTLENYINSSVPHNSSVHICKSMENPKQIRCDASCILSLPVVSTKERCVGLPLCEKDCSATDTTRHAESCFVVPSLIVKDRLSSESSDSSNSFARSRSISEESKASSSSASSANSCVFIADATMRRRFSSECESEDSFVVFEGGVDCVDYDSDSLSDSSEEGSDAETEDEVDSACPRVSMLICVPLPADEIEIFARSPKMQEVCVPLPADEFEIFARSPKMQEVNAKWDRDCSPPEKRPSCKKVRFAASPRLATVHPMVKWDYAYRAARCGPWEEMARDRERFKQRVERSETYIGPVLGAAHRDRVATLLRGEGRHDTRPDAKHR